MDGYGECARGARAWRLRTNLPAGSHGQRKSLVMGSDYAHDAPSCLALTYPNESQNWPLYITRTLACMSECMQMG